MTAKGEDHAQEVEESASPPRKAARTADIAKAFAVQSLPTNRAIPKCLVWDPFVQVN